MTLMAKSPARITRFSFPASEAVMIIHARDSAGRDVLVSVPLGGIQRMAAEARRRISALEAQGEQIALPPPWHYTRFLPIDTLTVGLTETTEGQNVALLVDQGQETELGLRFPPEYARELARQLLEAADQAAQKSPAKH
jgi:hypothetical protein